MKAANTGGNEVVRIENILKNKKFRKFTEDQIGPVVKVEVDHGEKKVRITGYQSGREWSWSDFLEFENTELF